MKWFLLDDVSVVAIWPCDIYIYIYINIVTTMTEINLLEKEEP